MDAQGQQSQEAVISRTNELSAEKRELVNRLLKAEGLVVSLPALMPRSRGSDLPPLSFAQQRLWFLHQLAPEGNGYNEPFAFRLVGRLKVPILRSALDELVRRHEALRTCFPLRGGQPVQHVCPAGPVPLPVVDLGAVPARAEARRLVREEARRSFDLQSGPPLRMSLLRLGEEEHVLVAVLHHIQPWV